MSGPGCIVRVMCCGLENCTYLELFVFTGMRGVVHLGLSQDHPVFIEDCSFLKTGVLYFSLGEKSGNVKILKFYRVNFGSVQM